MRTHQLLARKYSLSADEVGAAVGHFLDLDGRTRHRFEQQLVRWQARPGRRTRDALLDAALTVLEHLKAIVLAADGGVAVENIYQKRHIAAGIPSIYGNYTERRFDALGLSFRVENLVARLLDDVVAEGIEQYVTRASLRRMAKTLRRFERALAVDGVDSRALGANLPMLETSFDSRNFSFRQYQNVFQFLMNSVTELSSTSVLSHEQVLHAVLVNDPRQCQARGLSVDAVAELVLREVLVSGLGLQALDRYVSAALRQLSTLNGRLDSRGLTRMMNYDPERLVSHIHKPRKATDDQRTLGFKGLGLKQMTSYGHKVPDGFVLSTELFSAMPAMSYPPLYDDTIHRLRDAVAALERRVGLRLGDPRRLLLLSIRSGAAISMPGLMTTFVNVGLNDQLVEAFASRPETAWAAWDSYRRFLQSWAMSYGIDRDFFDTIMTEYKARYGVGQKLDFTGEQMREIAFAYKSRARDHGVVFVDEPFAQVVACMRKVLESWDSAPARVYRQYLGVAEEWGTAVVVQRMVYGNLSRESGSGVTFTNNPLEPYSRQVRLFGDFAVRSQGEDLVGGLVFPWPISEAQRLGSLTYRGTEHSLERDFPDIYDEAARGGPGPRRRAGVRPAGDRVHLRVAGGVGPLHPAEALRRAGADPRRRLLRHHLAQLRAAGGGGHGRGRRRLLGARRHQRRAARPAARRGAGREHRAPASGHRARGHRHDHAGQRHPHRPRRHHVARRRHRQAPGQDGGRRVRRPRGVGEDRDHPSRRPGPRRRRLGVHRRQDGQHLPRAHPHDRPAAAPAPPLRRARRRLRRRAGRRLIERFIAHSRESRKSEQISSVLDILLW